MAALAPAPQAAQGDESHLPKAHTWRQWVDREAWRKAIIAVPYLWLLLFFIAPFFIVLAISAGTSQVGIPPVIWKDTFPYGTFDNYVFLTQDDIYWQGYLNSIRNAAISTFFALLIGYPMALGIARASSTWRNVLLLLVILPFWTSFLLRVYAWIGLLGNTSWFNRGLTSILSTFFPFWVTGDHIQMMNTNFAVVLGIVYSYLPFMILPLYATLEKLDRTLDEAAMDLGSKPWQVFKDITLPLSLPGIIAGAMLVFIPATGEYVIPSLMGRGDSPMIGRVLADEFFQNRDWPVASAVAVALLAVLVIPIMVYNFFQAREAQRRAS
jgi:putrescine transport system permease protein